MVTNEDPALSLLYYNVISAQTFHECHIRLSHRLTSIRPQIAGHSSPEPHFNPKNLYYTTYFPKRSEVDSEHYHHPHSRHCRFFLTPNFLHAYTIRATGPAIHNSCHSIIFRSNPISRIPPPIIAKVNTIVQNPNQSWSSSGTVGSSSGFAVTLDCTSSIRLDTF